MRSDCLAKIKMGGGGGKRAGLPPMSSPPPIAMLVPEAASTFRANGRQLMSTTTQSQSTYVIESSLSEYDRLVRIAQAFDPEVQDGWRRTGLRSGARAIDVGCGPLGALL